MNNDLSGAQLRKEVFLTLGWKLVTSDVPSLGSERKAWVDRDQRLMSAWMPLTQDDGEGLPICDRSIDVSMRYLPNQSRIYTGMDGDVHVAHVTADIARRFVHANGESSTSRAEALARALLEFAKQIRQNGSENG